MKNWFLICWLNSLRQVLLKAKNPQTLGENMQCAADGGDVARVAREQLEQKTGREVVTPLSAKRFLKVRSQKIYWKTKGKR